MDCTSYVYTSPNECFPEDLLISKLSPNLVCSICTHLFQDPVFMPSCGHSFCNNCAQSWLEHNPSCPICRTPQHRTGTMKAWSLIQLIGELKTRCPFSMAYNPQSGKWEPHPEKCQEILTMSSRAKHESVCAFATARCSNIGCSFTCLRTDIPAHEKICDFRCERCVCGQNVRVGYENPHSLVCPEGMVACPQADVGCKMEVRRHMLQSHLAVCPYNSLRAELLHKQQRIRELEQQNNALLAENMAIATRIQSPLTPMTPEKHTKDEMVSQPITTFVSLEGKVVPIQVQPFWSVERLKKMVEDIFKVPANYQMLTCNGMAMESNKLLMDHEISPNTVITVNLQVFSTRSVTVILPFDAPCMDKKVRIMLSDSKCHLAEVQRNVFEKTYVWPTEILLNGVLINASNSLLLLPLGSEPVLQVLKYEKEMPANAPTSPFLPTRQWHHAGPGSMMQVP